MLSKKGAVKFSREVLKSWKKLTTEENESWINQNFDEIWGKYDPSEQGMGMLNLE